MNSFEAERRRHIQTIVRQQYAERNNPSVRYAVVPFVNSNGQSTVYVVPRRREPQGQDANKELELKLQALEQVPAPTHQDRQLNAKLASQVRQTQKEQKTKQARETALSAANQPKTSDTALRFQNIATAFLDKSKKTNTTDTASRKESKRLETPDGTPTPSVRVGLESKTEGDQEFKQRQKLEAQETERFNEWLRKRNDLEQKWLNAVKLTAASSNTRIMSSIRRSFTDHFVSGLTHMLNNPSKSWSINKENRLQKTLKAWFDLQNDEVVTMDEETIDFQNVLRQISKQREKDEEETTTDVDQQLKEFQRPKTEREDKKREKEMRKQEKKRLEEEYKKEVDRKLEEEQRIRVQEELEKRDQEWFIERAILIENFDVTNVTDETRSDLASLLISVLKYESDLAVPWRQSDENRLKLVLLEWEKLEDNNILKKENRTSEFIAALNKITSKRREAGGFPDESNVGIGGPNETRDAVPVLLKEFKSVDAEAMESESARTKEIKRIEKEYNDLLEKEKRKMALDKEVEKENERMRLEEEKKRKLINEERKLKLEEEKRELYEEIRRLRESAAREEAEEADREKKRVLEEENKRKEEEEEAAKKRQKEEERKKREERDESVALLGEKLGRLRIVIGDDDDGDDTPSSATPKPKKREKVPETKPKNPTDKPKDETKVAEPVPVTKPKPSIFEQPEKTKFVAPNRKVKGEEKMEPTKQCEWPNTKETQDMIQASIFPNDAEKQSLIQFMKDNATETDQKQIAAFVWSQKIRFFLDEVIYRNTVEPEQTTPGKVDETIKDFFDELALSPNEHICIKALLASGETDVELFNLRSRGGPDRWVPLRVAVAMYEATILYLNNKTVDTDRYTSMTTHLIGDWDPKEVQYYTIFRLQHEHNSAKTKTEPSSFNVRFPFFWPWNTNPKRLFDRPEDVSIRPLTDSSWPTLCRMINVCWHQLLDPSLVPTTNQCSLNEATSKPEFLSPGLIDLYGDVKTMIRLIEKNIHDNKTSYIQYRWYVDGKLRLVEWLLENYFAIRKPSTAATHWFRRLEDDAVQQKPDSLPYQTYDFRYYLPLRTDVVENNGTITLKEYVKTTKGNPPATLAQVVLLSERKSKQLQTNNILFAKVPKVEKELMDKIETARHGVQWLNRKNPTYHDAEKKLQTLEMELQDTRKTYEAQLLQEILREGGDINEFKLQNQGSNKLPELYKSLGDLYVRMEKEFEKEAKETNKLLVALNNSLKKIKQDIDKQVVGGQLKGSEEEVNRLNQLATEIQNDIQVLEEKQNEKLNNFNAMRRKRIDEISWGLYWQDWRNLAYFQFLKERKLNSDCVSWKGKDERLLLWQKNCVVTPNGTSLFLEAIVCKLLFARTCLETPKKDELSNFNPNQFVLADDFPLLFGEIKCGSSECKNATQTMEKWNKSVAIYEKPTKK